MTNNTHNNTTADAMNEATQAIQSLIDLVSDIVHRSDMTDVSKNMAIDTVSESAVRIAEIYGGTSKDNPRRN